MNKKLIALGILGLIGAKFLKKPIKDNTVYVDVSDVEVTTEKDTSGDNSYYTPYDESVFVDDNESFDPSITPFDNMALDMGIDRAFYDGNGLKVTKPANYLLSELIVDNGANPVVSKDELIQAYKDICGSMGISYKLVMAIHTVEGIRRRGYPAPLIITGVAKSGATGLGQFVENTSLEIGILQYKQMYYKTAIWSTCKLLLNLGYNKGLNLVSASEIAQAEKNAGTNKEPKWYHAMRAYYSLSVDDFKASKDNASMKLNRALKDESKLIISLEDWNYIVPRTKGTFYV